MIGTGRFRTFVAAFLSVFLLMFGAPAWSAVEHDVTVFLDPAAGRIEVTHRLSTDGGSPVKLLLPGLLTVENIAVNGRDLTAPVDGRVLEIESDANEPTQITATYGANPWAGPPDAGPFVNRNGAFLPGGSGWLLTAAGGEQSWHVDVAVGLPYRAVLTGRLIAENEADGVYRARFGAETPLEPPSLFAGHYQINERNHNGILLRTYFGPNRAALAEGYLATAADHIDLFSDRIGPYPFSGFSMVAAPLPVGLGFPGLTYVSDRILPLPFMRGRSLAHEIAHNWWGNGVGVDYASGNWAEGLTSFMADYGLAERAGGDGVMRLEWLRDFAALPAERDMPLAQFTFKSHDAAQVVGYGKGAFLFIMLRDALGPQVFDNGLRRFWAEWRFRVASWDDLRRAFEAESGSDLRPFFSQWLNRPGAPSVSLIEATARRHGEGATVAVTLRQTTPPYALSVPLHLETETGGITHRVMMDGEEKRVELQVSTRPRAVRLDPQHLLFRRLAPGEAPPILRDVTLDGESATHVAVGADAASEAAARALAARLVEAAAVSRAATKDRSTLLIALDGSLDQALTELDAGPVPQTLEDRGTARVWTVRRDNGTVVLVVTARDAAALQALARPLPHYRRQSYLGFDGATVIDRGVWPSDADALTHVFD